MSRSVGAEVPAAWLERVRAEPGSGPERVVVLVTVDPAGWPHPAVVTEAELVALSPGRLRLALHRGSRTGRWLAETRKATLVVADETLCLYVKVEAEALPPAAAAPELARFQLTVQDVLLDQAEGDEAGARLTGRLGVMWPRPDEGLARARRLRTVLLA